MSATGRQRIYVHLRTLEPPIKVPQHCIAPYCQEHYASGAANGRNVARHRDNNTVYLHCYALPNVCRNWLACLPAKSICLMFRNVKWILASHQKYSNLSPITRQLSSIIQPAPYGIARMYKNDLLKPDVILRIFVRKRYNDIVMVLNERERMRKEEEKLTENVFRRVDVQY